MSYVFKVCMNNFLLCVVPYTIAVGSTPTSNVIIGFPAAFYSQKIKKNKIDLIVIKSLVQKYDRT